MMDVSLVNDGPVTISLDSRSEKNHEGDHDGVVDK